MVRLPSSRSLRRWKNDEKPCNGIPEVSRSRLRLGSVLDWGREVETTKETGIERDCVRVKENHRRLLRSGERERSGGTIDKRNKKL